MTHDFDQLLQSAAYAGQLLLESGAEIYRVEDTICRICLNYGAQEASSIVLPTGIFVTIVAGGRSVSKIVRIKSRGLDIDRIDRINTLSRQSKTLSLDEFLTQLRAIALLRPYSLSRRIAAGALGAGGFTLFFGGRFSDLCCALVIGGLIEGCSSVLEQRQFPSFFAISLCSALTALLAIGLNQIGLAPSLDALIIGCLMLLVPGLAITNAIRDSLSGDLISGMTRGVEAVLIAIAVALGPGLVMSLWMMLGGNPLW